MRQDEQGCRWSQMRLQKQNQFDNLFCNSNTTISMCLVSVHDMSLPSWLHHHIFCTNEMVQTAIMSAPLPSFSRTMWLHHNTCLRVTFGCRPSTRLGTGSVCDVLTNIFLFWILKIQRFQSCFKHLSKFSASNFKESYFLTYLVSK